MKNSIRIFEALSDENRLRIINLLSVSPELCVADIEKITGLPQSRISRHLAYLKSRDMVESRRKSTWMYYALGPAFSQYPELKQLLRNMLSAEGQSLVDMELLLEGLDDNNIHALTEAKPETIERVIEACCNVSVVD